MFSRLKRWWTGEFRNTPLHQVLSGEPFENVIRPWPVRLGRAIWSFYLQHWKWFWGALHEVFIDIRCGIYRRLDVASHSHRRDERQKAAIKT